MKNISLVGIHDMPDVNFNPANVYNLDDTLKAAVEAAIMLNQPLLITGEPGTGKTTLAYKVAKDLAEETNSGFAAIPLFFATKSTTVASDLFYIYDAITNFFDANIARKDTTIASPPVSKYITLQALGKAILAGNREFLNDENLVKQLPNPDVKNFVVLIDEIDKAQRDFPNDILHEIESYSFKIREMGNKTFTKIPNARILVIMTSNSEKALPDAFLRRCMFYNIDFPTKDKLSEILDSHLNEYNNTHMNIDFKNKAINRFIEIRNTCMDKKPATAELINWVRYLSNNRFNFEQVDQETIINSLGIIVKSKNDLNLVNNLAWIKKS
jgi:MoxR-like ATPase